VRCRFARRFGSGMSDEEEMARYNVLHDRFSGPAVALCLSLGGYFFKSAQVTLSHSGRSLSPDE
jgi:hypothetical protein